MDNNAASTPQVNNIPRDFEKLFHDDLYGYLLSAGMVDSRLPEAPDLEELWPKIAESYMADGIREYNTGYAPVSLGWMMFIGMAVAKYWDVEWSLYAKVPDIYKYLRDRIDYDHMDDYILDTVLCLSGDMREKINDAVAECASRTFSQICHMHIEQGTADAFRAYVSALHQLYLMGVAVELKSLGYHMTKV